MGKTPSDTTTTQNYPAELQPIIAGVGYQIGNLLGHGDLGAGGFGLTPGMPTGMPLVAPVSPYSQAAASGLYNYMGSPQYQQMMMGGQGALSQLFGGMNNPMMTAGNMAGSWGGAAGMGVPGLANAMMSGQAPGTNASGAIQALLGGYSPGVDTAGAIQGMMGGNVPGIDPSQFFQDVMLGSTQGQGTGTASNVNPVNDPTQAMSQLLAGTSPETVQGIIDTTADDMTRAFQRNELMQISDGAQNSGQMGGTRQGVAEGVASAELGQDILGMAAQTRENIRASDLSNMLGASQIAQQGRTAQDQTNLAIAQMLQSGGQFDVSSMLQAGQLAGQQQNVLGNLMLGGIQAGNQQQDILGQLLGMGISGGNQQQQILGNLALGGGQLGSDAFLGGQGMGLEALMNGMNFGQAGLTGGLAALPGMLNAPNQGLDLLNNFGILDQTTNQLGLEQFMQQYMHNQTIPTQDMSTIMGWIGGVLGNGAYGSSTGPGSGPTGAQTASAVLAAIASIASMN